MFFSASAQMRSRFRKYSTLYLPPDAFKCKLLTFQAILFAFYELQDTFIYMRSSKKFKRRRVLYLNLSTFYNYYTHKGIVDFAAHHDWTLSYVASAPNRDLLSKLSGYDGIICFSSDKRHLQLIHDNTGVPLVVTTSSAKELRIKRVVFNDMAIGRMAAEYLVNKGFKRIFMVYSGKIQKKVAENRMKGLGELAKEHDVFIRGVSLKVFSRILSKTELPFAVILTNDTLAQEVIYSIRDRKLNIPTDVAILGVDNDPLYCETSGVPVSSLKINAEKRGTLAAQCLDRLMDGSDDFPDITYIEPEGVVERISTDVYAIPHVPTVKALRYLHAHIFEKALTVNDIVSQSGVCRRRLEKTFLHYLNRSIPNEILRLRIAKVINLIRHSGKNISEIAEECGFSSHQSMSRVFKRKLKKTPSSFKNDA